MHRALRVALVAAVFFGGSGCNEDGADRVDSVAETADTDRGTIVIRPGRANWSTGYFQAAIFAALLEELGYEVDDPAMHEYPPPEAYPRMASGEFDFWANGWYSQHERWHADTLADGSVVGDHLVVVGHEVPAGGLEGLVVTRSVADRHAIESLDQINGDPALVELFDADGDGRAEVHGCPEDWTCDDIIDETIARNRWSNLEQVKAGFPGMIATSIERVARGEPVIQYVWSPSGYLTELVPGESVLWLSLGGHEHVIDGTTPGGYDFSHADPAPFVDECTSVPCWIGWEVADIRVTVNKDFAAANPEAVALFEQVELSVADIAAQNVKYDAGEDTEPDVRRHAAEWITEHRDLVDAWLADVSARN